MGNMLLLLMGIIFFVVGGFICAVLFGLAGSSAGGFLLIPFVFVLLGLGFIIGAGVSSANKKKIRNKGKRYAAKIYGYTENSRLLINGYPAIDTKVHYFDDKHIEKEAILKTGFARGGEEFAVGMTIDIYEYKGQFEYDKNSLRNEYLAGEEELMDDKPILPEEITYVAVSCPNCGSNFRAMANYSNKCPYCGSYCNVGNK